MWPKPSSPLVVIFLIKIFNLQWLVKILTNKLVENILEPPPGFNQALVEILESFDQWRWKFLTNEGRKFQPMKAEKNLGVGGKFQPLKVEEIYTLVESFDQWR